MKHSKIEKKIRYARIAAMVSGTITLAGWLSGMIHLPLADITVFHMLTVIDVIFIFSMAYGIYRKSRVCAVLMFEYFLFSKLFSMATLPQLNMGVLFVGTLFLYFLYQGISGTFAHHQQCSSDTSVTRAKPFKWIMAGSGGLMLYVLVMPLMILQ